MAYSFIGTSNNGNNRTHKQSKAHYFEQLVHPKTQPLSNQNLLQTFLEPPPVSKRLYNYTYPNDPHGEDAAIQFHKAYLENLAAAQKRENKRHYNELLARAPVAPVAPAPELPPPPEFNSEEFWAEMERIKKPSYQGGGRRSRHRSRRNRHRR